MIFHSVTGKTEDVHLEIFLDICKLLPRCFPSLNLSLGLSCILNAAQNPSAAN